MPVLTGSVLLRRVREYADQHDEGDGSRSFVTDNMIYSWLSKGYRTALRAMVRGGYPLSMALLSSAAPGATVAFGGVQALAIASVHVLRGSTLVPLPRLVFGQEITAVGTYAAYWRPAVSSAGVFTLELYPNESIGTVRVKYLPDPADLTDASSVYLPSSWEDVLVLGAALRCGVRTNEHNQLLKDLYVEALAEAEADTSNAMSENVIRNTDHIYPPGYDQGRQIDRNAEYDYSPYILP